MSFAVLFLAGALAVAGTELRSDGQLLFQAESRVTFGATYGARAVRATVVAPGPTRVAIHTDRRPRNVFVTNERLPLNAWTYDDDSRMVELELPAGSSSLQIRFDDVASLAPFTRHVPVVICAADWLPRRPAGTVPVECVNERFSGTLTWEGSTGIYAVRATFAGQPRDNTVVNISSRAARPLPQQDDSIRVLLEDGWAIDLAGEALGMRLPFDQIAVRPIARIAPTRRIPKDALPWDESVVVEGENFDAEGGGAIKTSTEHQNTHGGGCIFTWADPGHWISWVLPVPKAGDYLLTIVIATDEERALRHLALNGEPLSHAPIAAFPGTGGWGRQNPDEWQPCQPLAPNGAPVVLSLTAGNHHLRMENAIGEHMNVDCILLTPVDAAR